MELLILILQFLPPNDKLRLKATCRRLHSAASDPAAWPCVALDYFSTRDKKLMTTSLRLCAPALTYLSVNARCYCRFPFAHFSKLLSRCKNLQHLTVTGVAWDSADQMNKLIASLPMLTHLHMGFATALTSPPFFFPQSHCRSALKSFKAMIYELQSPHFYTMLNALRMWKCNQFFPSLFQLEVDMCHRGMMNIQNWGLQEFISDYFQPLPSGKEVLFQVMNKERPLMLAPTRPLLEVKFGSSCSVTVMCGEGIPGHTPLVLVSSRPHSATVCVTSSCPQVSALSVPFLSVAHLLVHLDLRHADVLSTHLEELANHCPLLESLNLKHCRNSLSCLTGLQNISVKCKQLRDISLLNIHNIEDTAKLWRMLGSFPNLSQLRISACFLVSADSSESVVSPIPSLQALEIRPFSLCRKCMSTSYRHYSALSSLAATHLRFFNVSCLCTAVTMPSVVFTAFSNLKSLCFESNASACLPTEKACYRNLDQCYILTWASLPDVVVDALTDSGSIVHMVLCVASVSKEAMCKIIKLPRLISCHVRVIAARGKRNITQFIRKAAKAQGIPEFSYEIVNNVSSLSSTNHLMSSYLF